MRLDVRYGVHGVERIAGEREARQPRLPDPTQLGQCQRRLLLDEFLIVFPQGNARGRDTFPGNGDASCQGSLLSPIELSKEYQQRLRAPSNTLNLPRQKNLWAPYVRMATGSRARAAESAP